MFGVYKSDSHRLFLSTSVKVKNKTAKNRCKGFLPSYWLSLHQILIVLMFTLTDFDYNIQWETLL